MTAKHKDLLVKASGDLLQSVQQLLESYVAENDESLIAVAARKAVEKATGAVVLRCQLQGCDTQWIRISNSNVGRPRTKYCSDFCRTLAHNATAAERVRLSRQRRRDVSKNQNKVTT